MSECSAITARCWKGHQQTRSSGSGDPWVMCQDSSLYASPRGALARSQRDGPLIDQLSIQHASYGNLPTIPRGTIRLQAESSVYIFLPSLRQAMYKTVGSVRPGCNDLHMPNVQTHGGELRRPKVWRRYTDHAWDAVLQANIYRPILAVRSLKR